MKTKCSAPDGFFRPVSTLIVTGAVSVALLPGLSAASFSFAGSLRSSDNTAPPNPPLIVVPVPGLGEVPFYAWKAVDNGQGIVSAHAGFGSLSGVLAADLTFEFGDLELLQLDFGANTATQTYGEADAGARFFNLYLQGNKIATGMDFSLSIVTDTDRNSPNFTLATGTGSVTLQSVGGHGFVDDLAAIQGSPVLNLSVSSFTSPVFVANPTPGIERAAHYFNDYTIAGGGTAVPEPEAYAALAAAGLVGWATWRRVKSAR
jgi:hypothetical protein